jgi:hypothetical protein
VAEGHHRGLDEGRRFAQHGLNPALYFLLQGTDLCGWHGWTGLFTGSLTDPPQRYGMPQIITKGLKRLRRQDIQITLAKLQHPAQTCGVRQSIHARILMRGKVKRHTSSRPQHGSLVMYTELYQKSRQNPSDSVYTEKILAIVYGVRHSERQALMIVDSDEGG